MPKTFISIGSHILLWYEGEMCHFNPEKIIIGTIRVTYHNQVHIRSIYLSIHQPHTNMQNLDPGGMQLRVVNVVSEW